MDIHGYIHGYPYPRQTWRFLKFFVIQGRHLTDVNEIWQDEVN